MTDKLDLFSCSQSHLNLNEIDFFNIRIASHSFTISPILITPSICWMEAFTPDLIYERTLESNVKLLLIFGSSSNKINIQHQHWVVILLDFISDLSRPRFPQAKWRYELTSCKNYDSNCIVYYIIRRMIKSYSYVVEKGFSLLGSKKWCLFVVIAQSVLEVARQGLRDGPCWKLKVPIVANSCYNLQCPVVSGNKSSPGQDNDRAEPPASRLRGVGPAALCSAQNGRAPLHRLLGWDFRLDKTSHFSN